MAPRPSLPTSKKRKHASDGTDATSSIKSLEDQLIGAVASKSSLNPLADLLDIARNAADPQLLSKAIYALYRVFVVIITNGLLLNVAGSDETKAVRAWIQEKLNSYVELLTGLLKDEESVLKVRYLNSTLHQQPLKGESVPQTSALKILLSLQKHLSTSVSRAPGSSTGARPQFYISHFRQIINGLLLCPPSIRATNQTKKRKNDSEDDGKLDPEVRDMFMETWLSEYDDIRWFFLREAA